MRRPKTKPSKKRKAKVSPAQKAYRSNKRAARQAKPRRRHGGPSGHYEIDFTDEAPHIEYRKDNDES